MGRDKELIGQEFKEMWEDDGEPVSKYLLSLLFVFLIYQRQFSLLLFIKLF